MQKLYLKWIGHVTVDVLTQGSIGTDASPLGRIIVSPVAVLEKSVRPTSCQQFGEGRFLFQRDSAPLAQRQL